MLANLCLACLRAHPEGFLPFAHSRPSSSLASLALLPFVSYSLLVWNGPEGAILVGLGSRKGREGEQVFEMKMDVSSASLSLPSMDPSACYVSVCLCVSFYLPCVSRSA